MSKIQIVTTDITAMRVDAVVNAANNALCGGGGVDGAIHRAAGPKLLEKCRQLGGCDTGFAKITEGYDLQAKYIIHAVGPVWYGGHKDEEALLRSCYRECLKLADSHSINSIAFPAISCGAYKFPIELACNIALDEVSFWLSSNGKDKVVYFVCFDKKIERQYTKLISNQSRT